MMSDDTPQDATLGDDLLHYAWTIICNAGGGNWENETPEWQEAAARFHTEYHALLASAPRVPLSETDPALIEALTRLFGEYGPAGVAGTVDQMRRAAAPSAGSPTKSAERNAMSHRLQTLLASGIRYCPCGWEHVIDYEGTTDLESFDQHIELAPTPGESDA